MDKIKLHLGNGTVYLEDGWLNIDIYGSLASERPDLVAHNKTTVDKYFKFPLGENKGNLVTDVKMDARKLEFKDGTVDEILCVDLLDHVKKEDITPTLTEWKRVLKRGGQLFIDVDDRVQQAKKLICAESVNDFERALKLIYCESGEGMKHWWGFTPWYLRHLLIEIGFLVVWEKTDYIIHNDPHFQLCAQK